VKKVKVLHKYTQLDNECVFIKAQVRILFKNSTINKKKKSNESEKSSFK